MKYPLVNVLLAVCLTAVGTAALAACKSATPALNSLTNKLEISLGNCVGVHEAWIAEYDSRVSQATFYPDLKASYWASSVPLANTQGAHWEIRGTMPDARFSSLEVYTLDGVPMGAVVDEDYQPLKGSVNWIRHSGRYSGTLPLQFSATLREVAATTPMTNGELRVDKALVAASKGKLTAIAYRVYANQQRNTSVIPAGLSQGDWQIRGQVALPELVYVIDDPRQAHYQSSQQIIDVRNKTGLRIPRALAGLERIGDYFVSTLREHTQMFPSFWQSPPRWQASAGLAVHLRRMIEPADSPKWASMWASVVKKLPNFSAFPNRATRYFVAGINPARGEVLVTRFKAPTAPDPDRGDRLLPRAQAPQQVRYWSACLNNTLTFYTTGCLNDTQVNVGEDGYATLVMSATNTPPVDMAGKPATNWLRHGSPNQLLLIRHMWPSAGFQESAFYYKGNPDNVAALKAWSKDYYPVSTYCSFNNFRYNNCRWKFNAEQEQLFSSAPAVLAQKYPR